MEAFRMDLITFSKQTKYLSWGTLLTYSNFAPNIFSVKTLFWKLPVTHNTAISFRFSSGGMPWDGWFFAIWRPSKDEWASTVDMKYVTMTEYPLWQTKDDYTTVKHLPAHVADLLILSG